VVAIAGDRTVEQSNRIVTPQDLIDSIRRGTDGQPRTSVRRVRRIEQQTGRRVAWSSDAVRGHGGA
jgi:hypothetical protein